jgi:hypothetical protein
VLTQDSHVDVAASTIGDFGSSDFSIEFTFTGNGVDDITPDGIYGALFIRSSQTEGDSLYTGPTAFIWDNGDIKFRMRGDDAMMCTGALPNPKSASARVLRFMVMQSTLSLSVDGVQTCFRAMTTTPDASQFVSAPLRLGGNHANSDGQNLHAKLSSIKLDDVSGVSTSESAAAEYQHVQCDGTLINSELWKVDSIKVDCNCDGERWCGNGVHNCNADCDGDCGLAGQSNIRYPATNAWNGLTGNPPFMINHFFRRLTMVLDFGQKERITKMRVFAWEGGDNARDVTLICGQVSDEFFDDSNYDDSSYFDSVLSPGQGEFLELPQENVWVEARGFDCWTQHVTLFFSKSHTHSDEIGLREIEFICAEPPQQPSSEAIVIPAGATGCTDAYASNYDSHAVTDDDTCIVTYTCEYLSAAAPSPFDEGRCKIYNDVRCILSCTALVALQCSDIAVVNCW